MRIIANPLRNKGLPDGVLDDTPYPSVEAGNPKALLDRCPMHDATPLLNMADLANAHGVGSIHLKDERPRLNLGSFKALGAAYVIANLANNCDDPVSEKSLNGSTFVTASAGNHGLSVARGSQIFGAKAVIYIAETVPESFASRLRDNGADVRREGANYEASMAAALKAAEDNNWTLLSDSSWEGYNELPHRLMEGYLTLAEEIGVQIEVPPTHIFLQAGVGGMAGAVAAYFRKIWHASAKIIIVEPEAAPALIDSIIAQSPTTTDGPVSNMGRLDCKTPSFIALKGLARDADYFMTIDDQTASDALADLANNNCATTPSGGAGYAGFLAAKTELALDAEARILAIISEVDDA